jgi:CheY-like chemotaxis protein
MKGRMLVLDDDEDTLEVLSMVLQDEGYDVYQRDLLIEDLAEVERLAPHVMIVDVFMGARQAGWEFIQRLKAHPPTASIPIMLCTAGRLTPEQIHTSQLQGIAIVYKPFDLHELLELVHRLIGVSPSS